MGSSVIRQPGETFAGYSELETKACAVCGVLYAAPALLFEKKFQNGGDWYCPNGHNLHFVETVKQKLERERREHEATRDLLEHEQRSHARTRGEVTKLRRKITAIEQRIANGVCPCCNRTFKQVAAHMKRKHPEFVAELERDRRKVAGG